MDEKRKRIITFIGTLFIAVMFVGSYAAFNNSGTATTTSSTSTVQGGATFFVSGTSNAQVTAYPDLAGISLLSNSSGSQVGNVLAQMQNNGSISSYIAQGNGYQVFTQNLNAYNIQQVLYAKVGNSSVTVNASVSVKLPAMVQLDYKTQIINVEAPNSDFQISISPLQSIGSNVLVTIHALVYSNGSVANGQITVMPA